MALLLLLSLHTLQICFGQTVQLPQQQQLPSQQQPIPQVQPPLYPSTPPTGAGQPGSMVDLFRMAAASFSQTLINLLNYKAQWLNQLASNMPPIQNTPSVVGSQPSSLLPTLTGGGFQSPGVLSLQSAPTAPVGSVPPSGFVATGNPNTGLQGPTYQQPLAAPAPGPTYQQPLAAPAPGPTNQQPLAAPGPGPTYQQPLAAPGPVNTQSTQPQSANPLQTPLQAPLPQTTPLTGVNPLAATPGVREPLQSSGVTPQQPIETYFPSLAQAPPLPSPQIATGPSTEPVAETRTFTTNQKMETLQQ